MNMQVEIWQNKKTSTRTGQSLSASAFCGVMLTTCLSVSFNDSQATCKWSMKPHFAAIVARSVIINDIFCPSLPLIWSGRSRHQGVYNTSGTWSNSFLQSLSNCAIFAIEVLWMTWFVPCKIVSVAEIETLFFQAKSPAQIGAFSLFRTIPDNLIFLNGQ